MHNNYFKGTRSIPDRWYNVIVDFPNLYIPFIDPKTHKSVTALDMPHLFPENLALQDCNKRDRYIKIPEKLLEIYSIWRPTPLIRALNLERLLDTQCKIFFKYEGTSPTGSHKPNSSIVQAFYCKNADFDEIITETGAGQVGSAVSMAAAFFNLKCKVFMVKNSYETKPGRRILMNTFGADVVSSPSNQTDFGKSVISKDPNFPGSLGVAIAEAVQYVSSNSKAAYVIGSAFNYVCLHQTIIGMELKNQLESCNINPDFLVCCIGGGSGFAGITFPFLREKIEKKVKMEFIAVESNAVPRVSKGIFNYDYGDTACFTPLIKMYTLGHEFAPPVIHSGGLRYHGLSPLVSKFLKEGYGKVLNYSQLEIFQAAELFTKCEGYLPAPEAAHSVKAAIDLAKQYKREKKIIVFCLTGHGFFDLVGYKKYYDNTLEDSTTPDDKINISLNKLKKYLEVLNIKEDNEKDKIAIPSNDFESWWNKHFNNQGNNQGLNDTYNESPYNSYASIKTDERKIQKKVHDILTENKIKDAIENNEQVIHISKKCIITPLARDTLNENNISLRYE